MLRSSKEVNWAGVLAVTAFCFCGIRLIGLSVPWGWADLSAGMYTSCIVVNLARQISVSNEVYELLLERKGKKSFSEVIKESLCQTKKKPNIMRLAGILKDDKEDLERLKQQIAAEREANYGRTFK
jgi:predicted CopG family antitoxin